MPLYEYEEIATGNRIELFRTVEQRDQVPENLRRVVSLSGRGPFTGSLPDPRSADVAVPRAFRQLEATQPRDRIERECGFTVKQLKRTWNFK